MRIFPAAPLESTATRTRRRSVGTDPITTVLGICYRWGIMACLVARDVVQVPGMHCLGQPLGSTCPYTASHSSDLRLLGLLQDSNPGAKANVVFLTCASMMIATSPRRGPVEFPITPPSRCLSRVVWYESPDANANLSWELAARSHFPASSMRDAGCGSRTPACCRAAQRAVSVGRCGALEGWERASGKQEGGSGELPWDVHSVVLVSTARTSSQSPPTRGCGTGAQPYATWQPSTCTHNQSPKRKPPPNNMQLFLGAKEAYNVTKTPRMLVAR